MKSPRSPIKFTTIPKTYSPILVVDDNATNRFVTQKYLNKLGLQSDIAKNGSEAFEYFKSNHPRVILMDVSMPVMNGLEATGAIRSLEGATNDPVSIIGLTGNSMSGDKATCLSAGMDEYLSKPVSLQELRDTIFALPDFACLD